MKQLSLFDQHPQPAASNRYDRSGTFTDNMKLPLHRWFRYSAGFSAEWVEAVIAQENFCSTARVLDPFCGSGTTLIAAAKMGLESIGLESHPFVARIAEVKTNWSIDIKHLEQMALAVTNKASNNKLRNIQTVSPLLIKCYSESHLFDS